MRNATLAIALVSGWSLLAATDGRAQAPVGARGGRYTGAYGGGAYGGGAYGGGAYGGGAYGGGAGMGGVGIGGTGATRSPFTSGRSRGTAKPAAAPSGPRSFGGSSSSGGMNLPGVGARRQLHRNNSPVVSPYLNLDPSFVFSDAGQYTMRTVPQLDANSAQKQTQQALQGVQSELGQQEQEYMSGLSTTGHTTSFKNLGRYYPPR